MIDLINKLVGVDVWLTDFEEIYRIVSRFNSAKVNQLVRHLDTALKQEPILREESNRVALAKLLTATIPYSLPQIERTLANKNSDLEFEMHFSLFCYLDEVQCFDQLRNNAGSVLAMVQTYICETHEDRQQALWMAADLLGDHWDLNESVPILLEALKNNKSQDAQTAIVDGLKIAAARPMSEDLRNKIGSVPGITLSPQL